MSVAERNLRLKQDIAASVPDFEAKVTAAWTEILSELERVTTEIASRGPDYLPSINFGDLQRLEDAQLAQLKKSGSFIVRGVLPREEALWLKQDLRDFVKTNPHVEGVPIDNPQHFQVFYTKSQLAARSHPNVLSASTFCNHLWNGIESLPSSAAVDLDTPLSYFDRLRMRQPGIGWSNHPPHMDAGAIDRWLDPVYRSVYRKILNGQWKDYDPYCLVGRVGAESSAAGLPNQASVFRTFQGWLSMSETGPTEGTLQVFPAIALITSYIILRPFFSCTVADNHPDALKVENWKYDLSSPDFPGISTDPTAGKGGGARPFELSPKSHPHLRLDISMISVPKVFPGDMVFWHCDMVHAVETEHKGKGDSSVMYIGATPSCAKNLAYIRRQAEAFEKGVAPSDFPRGRCELEYQGIGRPGDVKSKAGRVAMGLA